MFKKTLLVIFAVLTVNSFSVQAQPAPNLKSIRVVAVLSTGYKRQYDTVPIGALVTPNDHSGPELIVVTLEDGYSITNSQRATFLGLPMQQFKTEPYPSTGPIKGFYRHWYVKTPFTSGNFASEASSINTGRKSGTSIRIR
jgi:hypothetical protein